MSRLLDIILYLNIAFNNWNFIQFNFFHSLSYFTWTKFGSKQTNKKEKFKDKFYF